MIILYRSKSDTIGMFASSLCLLHCMLTPVLFIVQAQTVCHEVSVPFWWKLLDFVFLIISFFAIYWAAKSTSKQWIKYVLWLTWSVLCIIIFNEKIQWFLIPEYAIYIPSFGLVFLHLYNKKFCQCQKDQCCTVGNKEH
jgi:hypothetical protein